MTTTQHNELITDGLQRISEAARFLGVSRSYLYRLMSSGTLPYVKLGKSRRVPIRAVRNLAADHLIGTTSSDPR
jgi:excisionase family DNA binding protein